MVHPKIKKEQILCIVMALFILSPFTFSCKKKYPTFYISQTSKDYCVYKSGSYWIYRNDSTGTMDSIYTEHDPSIDITSRGGFQEEIIKIYLQGGFLTSYYIQHQCSSPDNSINYNEGDDRINLNIQESDTVQASSFSLWPNQPLNILQTDPCCYHQNCDYFISEVLSSFSYAGNNFSNVLHTNFRSADTTDSNPYAFSYHHYFVKHIGLIYIIEKSIGTHVHRTFGLVRWNVKQ